LILQNLVYFFDINLFLKGIHQIRKETATKDNEYRCPDPIPRLAKELAEESWLLCFDEFQVTDIADAMILHRLFTALFKDGIVLITTSNRIPDDLYQGGLQRVLFLPFIDLLKIKSHILNLDSGLDYRLTGTVSSKIFHFPNTPENEAAFEKQFENLTKEREVTRNEITFQGRKIIIPESTKNGIARFTFNDLCSKPLGAGDYNVICKNYHTVFVKGIPKMSLEQKTEAKRFIIFVDTLYETKTKLICSAETRLEELFTHDPTLLQNDDATNELLDFLKQEQEGVTIFSGQEEIFQFARCISRLKEMQTDGYLQANRSHTL